MSSIEWRHLQDAPVVERSPGFRRRDLWRGATGAKTQLVEIAPGACEPDRDVHEPGPEKVCVVSGVFSEGERDDSAGTFIHDLAGSSHVPPSDSRGHPLSVRSRG